MSKYFDIELTDALGRPRISQARVEPHALTSGAIKYEIRTKSGKVLSKLYSTETEANAALANLAKLRIPGINDRLYNAIVRHQIYLERYKVGAFNDVKPVLDSAIRDMVRKIGNLPPGATRERYERVLAEIHRINMEASDKLATQLKSEMRTLAVQERNFTHTTIASAIPADIAIKVGLPAIDAVRRLVTVEPFHGFVLEEWTKKIGTNATIKARQQLYIGLAEGDSVPKLVKRMEFVGDQSRRELEMIVRTAVNHVTNQAKSSVYAANADVVKAVMWRSTLDGKTSDICRARDGEEYPVDDHPVPPAHPNCRSVIVPIVKSLRELGLDMDDVAPGTRASMNGQVPATETYQTWLKKQDKEFITDVLGPTKAKMFMNDGLTLDKFVDSTGKTLTIKQLQAKL